MNAKKKIEVRAGRGTPEELEANGYVYIDEMCQTLAEAKRRAKYCLTEDFRISGEMSEQFDYACVWADGEILWDFFNNSKPQKEAA